MKVLVEKKLKQARQDRPGEERRFMEGPGSRLFEFFFIVRVLIEFIKGFRVLHFIGPCVTVFGSARFDEKHEYYQKARELGRRLAALKVTVMTGGGPGIMEAANRGAYESGGTSVGCNIRLPQEQAPNKFMHRWVTIRYLFVRKVLLVKYSFAFVVMPGGFGTMDEFFETLTLIQTGIIQDFPVVLFGTSYYTPIREMLEGMQNEGTIGKNELSLVLFTDDLDEALAHIRNFMAEEFRLARKKPSPLLAERKMPRPG